ncbi:hypothetical protein BH18ACT8_BH18ACT8_06500 [soil metagenome]
MSTPQWGSPPDSAGQPEWLTNSAPPESGSCGGRRRGVIIGASVAALALVGGGAFAAYQFLDSAGDQPADALPGGAIAYARIDFDPSASQKIAVVQLLRRVPQFEEETGITSDREDLRRVIVDRFLGDSECAELSFADDFQPWIGDRAGFAVVAAEGEPQPVVALQVTDQEQARDAVDALSACSNLASAGDDSSTLGAGGDGGEDSGIEFVGDYMLIAQSQELATDFAADAESAPLSAEAGFSTAMDSLGEPGVASFWADVDAIREQLAEQGNPEIDDVSSALQEVHSYSAAFRAGADYLEFATQVDSDTTLGGVDGNPIENLPGTTTLGAFSVSNAGDLVDSYWNQLGSFLGLAQPESFEGGVTEFERQSGLRLPEDLRTLLGDNVTAALDSTDLTPDTIHSAVDLADVNFGVRFTTDPAAIQDLLDRGQARIDESGSDFTFTTTETDDGLVVASNPDYAQTLADDGDLGDSEAFELAVPDAQEAVSAFYLDLDMIADLARDAGGETTNFLEPMRSFGIAVSPTEDGFTTATMRLTFD